MAIKRGVRLNSKRYEMWRVTKDAEDCIRTSTRSGAIGIKTPGGQAVRGWRYSVA